MISGTFGNTMVRGYSRAWANFSARSSASFTEFKVRSTTKLWRGSRGALWSDSSVSSSGWVNRFSGSEIRR